MQNVPDFCRNPGYTKAEKVSYNFLISLMQSHNVKLIIILNSREYLMYIFYFTSELIFQDRFSSNCAMFFSSFSFCFFWAFPLDTVMTGLGTTTSVHHYLHSLLSSLTSFIFLCSARWLKRATLPHTAMKIIAPDCLGGCHSTSVQLPVATSHLIYPLRTLQWRTKYCKNKLKVTEQMRVLSPAGWTR